MVNSTSVQKEFRIAPNLAEEFISGEELTAGFVGARYPACDGQRCYSPGTPAREQRRRYRGERRERTSAAAETLPCLR